MTNTRPEQIVDKNGKRTTVHKSNGGPTGGPDRLSSVPKPSKKVAAEEVRDAIADLASSSRRFSSDQANAISKTSIFIKLIGHDPSMGKPESGYHGGKTKLGWFGEHVSVSSVNNAIEQLVEDGVITKVSQSSRLNPWSLSPAKNSDEERERSVRFDYGTRAGYVLTEDLEEAVMKFRDKMNQEKIGRLRKKAEAVILQRHAQELEDELSKLREDAGV